MTFAGRGVTLKKLFCKQTCTENLMHTSLQEKNHSPSVTPRKSMLHGENISCILVPRKKFLVQGILKIRAPKKLIPIISRKMSRPRARKTLLSSHNISTYSVLVLYCLSFKHPSFYEIVNVHLATWRSLLRG